MYYVDSTDSRASKLQKKKNTQRVSFLKTALLRGESQSDGSSSVDSVVQKQKESVQPEKPATRKSIGALRNGSESEKQTESDTNDSVHIPSSPERLKSERTTEKERSNATHRENGRNLIARRSKNKIKNYPLKTSTRFEEATDSDNPNAVRQINLDSFGDSERRRLQGRIP